MPKKPLEEKLSTQIIVRVDDQTKKDFMNRVQTEGKSASEVIKAFIHSYLASKPSEAPDLLQMQSELENLKHEFSQFQNEVMGKLIA